MAKSADPREKAAINLNYLDAELDRRTIVAGLKEMRRISSAPAYARYVEQEFLPGPAIASDDELLEFARNHGTTVFHPTSTCRMGNDPLAVVDSELKVHGLENILFDNI